MSNVISELRRVIREDGAAIIDGKMFDDIQQQWILRAMGEDVLAQIKEDLELADARAGRAERLLESERKSSRARADWLRSAKLDAGYDPSVSFDVVWSDALLALKEKRTKT
jgi:hypothetical protein